MSALLPLHAEVEPDVDDLHWSRTVPYAFHGVRLRFDLATTVFASAGVDPGSALLLRHLQTVGLPDRARVLDVGCGHGVLGLVLLALDRERQVTLVDRDALACHYTARNLRLNELPADRAVIGGSLGYDDVPWDEPYDLIVSNLPGKAGEAVIADLVTGAGYRTRTGAVVAVVIVAPLADLVRRQFEAAGFELLVDRGNRSHQVLIARVVGPLPGTGPGRRGAFEAGRYDRDEVVLRASDLQWRARTVTGIEEFDSLNHATPLLRGALRGVRAGDCTIVNPGQGHRAVIAARSGQHVRYLVGRDLLALRASRRMLADNDLIDGRGPGPDLVHALSPPVDDATATMILHADDKVHTPWLIHEVTTWLAALPAPSPARRGSPPADRQLVLSGKAGLLGRIEAEILGRTRGRLAHKQNRNGYRVLRYQFRV